jgi:hypothetical protein
VRACAKYRLRVPLVGVAHDPRVANQLTFKGNVIHVGASGSILTMLMAAVRPTPPAASLTKPK